MSLLRRSEKTQRDSLEVRSVVRFLGDTTVLCDYCFTTIDGRAALFAFESPAKKNDASSGDKGDVLGRGLVEV